MNFLQFWGDIWCSIDLWLSLTLTLFASLAAVFCILDVSAVWEIFKQSICNQNILAFPTLALYELPSILGRYLMFYRPMTLTHFNSVHITGCCILHYYILVMLTFYHIWLSAWITPSSTLKMFVLTLCQLSPTCLKDLPPNLKFIFHLFCKCS